MAKHKAGVRWRSDGEFASGKFSRAHEWRFDGGAVVRGSSSPGVVPEPMSDAAAVDPEEALVASASACHLLTFLYLAHRAGLDVASYADDAEGTLAKTAEGRLGITRIMLRPHIEFNGRSPDAAELDDLHERAHEQCFIANSLRAEITVETA